VKFGEHFLHSFSELLRLFPIFAAKRLSFMPIFAASFDAVDADLYLFQQQLSIVEQPSLRFIDEGFDVSLSALPLRFEELQFFVSVLLCAAEGTVVDFRLFLRLLSVLKVIAVFELAIKQTDLCFHVGALCFVFAG
jgi:hypothetical protein